MAIFAGTTLGFCLFLPSCSWLEVDSTGPIGRPAIAGRFSLWTRANEKDILDTPLTKKTIMKAEHITDREEFFLVDSKKSFRPSFFFVKSRVCGVGCCLLFFFSISFTFSSFFLLRFFFSCATASFGAAFSLAAS